MSTEFRTFLIHRLSNPAFRPALVTLIKQVTNPSLRDGIAYEVFDSLGDEPPETVSNGALACVAITALAVEMGTPLHMTDAILLAWQAEPEGIPIECLRCGYRAPRAYTQCPLCKGNVAPPGSFSKRWAARAELN